MGLLPQNPVSAQLYDTVTGLYYSLANLDPGTQVAPTSAKVTLVAATAQTVLAAALAVRGARILNWTASPVYFTNGVSGTPASGAPSDYIPAIASTVPGQYWFDYVPISGIRAVGASAGDLTVEYW